MFSSDNTDRLAIAMLALLAVALVVWLYRVYRQTRYTPGQFPLYMFNLYMARTRWCTTVRGRIDIPPGQGALIVSNHLGPIDPGVIAQATNRPVHWMVAREFFSWPIFGWGLRTLAAIPTGRGGVDTAAIRAAVRYAQQGELVGMFPEGRINRTGQLLLPGRPGVALVALKARVPVVPCYIRGTPDDGTSWGFLFLASRATVIIGPPIDLSPWHGQERDKAVLETVTRRLMTAIAELAGQPHHPIQIAGRQWLPEGA